MIVSSTTEVSESEYIAAGYTIGEGESDITEYYFGHLSFAANQEAIYDAGGTHYHRNYYICLISRTNGKVYYRIDLSLRPALFSEKGSQ